MKILLAEDEKDMSSALTAILQHSGYDVDSVYDGQAAMKKALENVYDCLIFDNSPKRKSFTRDYANS